MSRAKMERRRQLAKLPFEEKIPILLALAEDSCGNKPGRWKKASPGLEMILINRRKRPFLFRVFVPSCFRD